MVIGGGNQRCIQTNDLLAHVATVNLRRKDAGTLHNCGFSYHPSPFTYHLKEIAPTMRPA